MSDQLFKIVDEGTYLEDEPDHKGWQRVDGFVTAVKPDYDAVHDEIGHIQHLTWNDVVRAVDAALKGTDDE